MHLLGPMGHPDQIFSKMGAPGNDLKEDVLEDEVFHRFSCKICFPFLKKGQYTIHICPFRINISKLLVV